MAVIAEKCTNIKVTVLDINKEKIDLWNSDDLSLLPVYEPGLKEIVSKVRNKNLFFSYDIEKNIAEADMVFISVNTPTKEKGLGAGYASDLKWVESSARTVAKFAKNHTIVVEKSTLPVRTAELIKKILEESNSIEKSECKNSFSVLSNPEFLAEGSAIDDLRNPDRVLIGGDDEVATSLLSSIYENWISKEKILLTNLWSSELSKLTANAFLAQRISSINSISALCEATGAEIKEVSGAVGLDKRIGSKFLNSGPGFGGSCFQKDILNLVYICRFYGLNEVADYWESVVRINNWQRRRISSIVIQKLFGTITSKKLAILGFSFKANTNDTRESPAIFISKDLFENGAILSFHDPKVSEAQIKNILEKEVIKENNQSFEWEYQNDLYDAIDSSDAVLILTEWFEYSRIDWSRCYKLMRKPAWIFDTRNIVNPIEVKSSGINYWGVGNGS